MPIVKGYVAERGLQSGGGAQMPYGSGLGEGLNSVAQGVGAMAQAEFASDQRDFQHKMQLESEQRARVIRKEDREAERLEIQKSQIEVTKGMTDFVGDYQNALQDLQDSIGIGAPNFTAKASKLGEELLTRKLAALPPEARSGVEANGRSYLLGEMKSNLNFEANAQQQYQEGMVRDSIDAGARNVMNDFGLHPQTAGSIAYAIENGPFSPQTKKVLLNELGTTLSVAAVYGVSKAGDDKALALLNSPEEMKKILHFSLDAGQVESMKDIFTARVNKRIGEVSGNVKSTVEDRTADVNGGRSSQVFGNGLTPDLVLKTQKPEVAKELLANAAVATTLSGMTRQINSGDIAGFEKYWKANQIAASKVNQSLRETISQVAIKHGGDPNDVLAFGFTETGLQDPPPKTVVMADGSSQRIYGPMQVGDRLLKDHGINNPEEATPLQIAEVGVIQSIKLMRKYGDRSMAWAAYNMGEGGFDRLLGKYGDDWEKHLPVNKKTGRSETAEGIARIRMAPIFGIAGSKLSDGVNKLIEGANILRNKDAAKAAENYLSSDPKYNEGTLKDKVASRLSYEATARISEHAVSALTNEEANGAVAQITSASAGFYGQMATFEKFIAPFRDDPLAVGIVTQDLLKAGLPPAFFAFDLVSGTPHEKVFVGAIAAKYEDLKAPLAESDLQDIKESVQSNPTLGSLGKAMAMTGGPENSSIMKGVIDIIEKATMQGLREGNGKSISDMVGSFADAITSKIYISDNGFWTWRQNKAGAPTPERVEAGLDIVKTTMPLLSGVRFKAEMNKDFSPEYFNEAISTGKNAGWVTAPSGKESYLAVKHPLTGRYVPIGDAKGEPYLVKHEEIEQYIGKAKTILAAQDLATDKKAFIKAYNEAKDLRDKVFSLRGINGATVLGLAAETTFGRLRTSIGLSAEEAWDAKQEKAAASKEALRKMGAEAAARHKAMWPGVVTEKK